jgi:hypothetical protein
VFNISKKRSENKKTKRIFSEGGGERGAGRLETVNLKLETQVTSRAHGGRFILNLFT